MQIVNVSVSQRFSSMDMDMIQAISEDEQNGRWVASCMAIHFMNSLVVIPVILLDGASLSLCSVWLTSLVKYN